MATIAVLKEQADGERRVALDPSAVARLTQAGHQVLIQHMAGSQAGFADADYSGVEWFDDPAAILGTVDVLVFVQPPSPAIVRQLRQGVVAAGIVLAHKTPEFVEALNSAGASTLAMELVPRISRAQSMDVLSSQATVAGYAAALRAASLAPKLFPMLTTAAGTLRPAQVTVIGAGVAGLQAIATAKRLGARVQAYDIRAAAREQVESLGARMIDTGVDAETAGGYARELTDEEKSRQASVLADRLAGSDAVIATAAVPGRPAPTIITADMVAGMATGSVIIDLAAESGGNCELTRPGETINHEGTVIDGPLNMPSRAATHASEMYARNLINLLELVFKEDGIHLDREDEVIAGTLLTHAGATVHASFTDTGGSH